MQEWMHMRRIRNKNRKKHFKRWRLVLEDFQSKEKIKWFVRGLEWHNGINNCIIIWEKRTVLVSFDWVRKEDGEQEPVVVLTLEGIKHPGPLLLFLFMVVNGMLLPWCHYISSLDSSFESESFCMLYVLVLLLVFLHVFHDCMEESLFLHLFLICLFFYRPVDDEGIIACRPLMCLKTLPTNKAVMKEKRTFIFDHQSRWCIEGYKQFL